MTVPRPDQELTEFERIMIQRWAVTDARQVVAEAFQWGLQVADYVDHHHWLHWQPSDLALNEWGHG